MILRQTPLSSLCSEQSEFSSAARPFRAHRIYARRIHFSCISRRYAAIWVRFLKNIVFKRAVNYFTLRAKSLKRDESFCLIFREPPRARPPCRKPSEKPLLSFRPSEARGEISVINIVLIVFYCLRRKNTAMTAFFKRFLDCARRRLFTPFGSCRAPLEMTFPAPTIFNNLSRVPKSQFWKSALNLSHTCDICRFP